MRYVVLPAASSSKKGGRKLWSVQCFGMRDGEKKRSTKGTVIERERGNRRVKILALSNSKKRRRKLWYVLSSGV